MSNQNIYNPTTGQYGYQVPGATLQPGWQPISSGTFPTAPTFPTITPTPTTSMASNVTSPDDQKLLAMGITPQQLQQLDAPGGMDSASFQSLIGNVEQKLKTNNDLVTQRGYLMKHLYDSPLTPDELQKLPQEIQDVVKTNDKNTVELQLRLLNDQIAGRANTLSQSIQTLTTGYQQAQQQRQDAINNFIKFAQQFPEPGDAAKAMEAIYGKDVIKQLGINIPELAHLITTSGIRYGAGGAGEMLVNIPSGTIAAQTNNPLNIKYSPTSIAGGTDSGIAAQDGGTFASFNSPEEGLQAAISLLQSPTYSNLTVDQAMKTWSNGAYGAEVSPSMSPSQKISSLSDNALQQLVLDMAKRESGATTSYQQSDIQAIATAIETGQHPPDLSRLYGKSAQVRAQLARDGYDFTKATLDWTATLAFVKNSNNPQQLRMRQAENSVENSLPKLQGYVDKLNQDGTMTGFQFVNRASLEAAKNGVFGTEVAADAQALLGQISLITDELGQTFMGGNSPTDAAFSLAKGVLAGNFTAEQFKTQIGLIADNLQIRKNSWANAGVVTLGGTNTYAPSSDNDPLGIR